MFLIILGLASELWSILTFSKKTEDAEVSEQSDFQRAPLATQSILLLLVLVHNWATVNNPYRLSLFSCTNQGNYYIINDWVIVRSGRCKRF